MSLNQISTLLQENILYALLFVASLSAVTYFVGQFILVRVVKALVKKTSTNFDDIIIKHLALKRLALIVPFIVILFFIGLFPEKIGEVLSSISKLIILWLITLSLSSILRGANIAYESREDYNGVSIKGYIDISRLILILIAIIISISIISKQSPMVLLAGLGAITAVLILIFQNTILSLVASVQIMANGLLKEGDTIEVPAFQANGTVMDITLHTIKVRNTDMTYSHIPTYKLLDSAFVNWRGVNESESRRIKRAVILDQRSIQQCDQAVINQVEAHPLLAGFWEGFSDKDSCKKMTNSALFRSYVEYYLRNREDIYQTDRILLVHLLAPEPSGVPLEIIAFVKTVDFKLFEEIQSEILEHLYAVVGAFKLSIFQLGNTNTPSVALE